jgi:hypothetical protein
MDSKNSLKKSLNSNTAALWQKIKNDKTNPIQKSLTHYTEMINLKIAEQKRTQTNPILIISQQIQFQKALLCGYIA